MKKIRIITLLFFLSASLASADEIEQAFSGKAPEAVVQSTRQLIQSGLHRADTIALTRTMLQNSFSAQQVLDAHAVLMQAHQQGIALESIINKAYEGMSKHIPAGNIVNAMKKVQIRYAFAKRQARKLTNQENNLNQMAQIIAAGLAAGMDPTGLATIVRQLQASAPAMQADQQTALAIETFKTARDMLRLGVSSSQSVSVVGAALQHQFNSEQMQNMRAAFVKNARTVAPQHLAASYVAAIEQGSSFTGSGKGQPGASGGSMGGSGSGGSGGGGNGPGGNH